MDRERLGQDLTDCLPWVETSKRVLENHLKPRPQMPQSLPTEMGEILAVK
jgi:hypothetical protein